MVALRWVYASHQWDYGIAKYKLQLSNKVASVEEPSNDRHLPDLGITYEDARAVLDQFMSQQISEDDFWWLLGFDFQDRRQNSLLAVLFKEGARLQYLVNKKKKGNTAHIWVNGDTACRCYANGSLGRKQSFEVRENPDDRSVCKNCLIKIGA